MSTPSSIPDPSVSVERFVAQNRAMHDQRHAEEATGLRQVWAAVAALNDQGFNLRMSSEPHSAYSYSKNIPISIGDLQRVYRAVGPVRACGRDVAHDKNGDPIEGMIEVTVKSVRYPAVRFTYHKPLPAETKRTRCKIVTSTQTTSYSRLVCEV